MKAHIHEVDLTGVERLFEVRIFERDSDAENCMELEIPYQGCKLIRIYKDNSAWVSLMHGIYNWSIYRQIRDYLFKVVNVDRIQWSGSGQIRKLKKRRKK